MPDVRHKRGTRAALDALAAGSGLLPGQIYVITDESRIAVALTASTYQAFLKQGEGSGASYAADVGDGVETAFVVTHSLGTRDVIVQARGTADPWAYFPISAAATTANSVTGSFASAPPTNGARILIKA
jgi:hypothetical protein